MIKDEIPASRKLGESDARAIARSSSTIYVAKGKKFEVFDMKSASLAEVTAKMLGPTGNLRAPTMRVGKKTVVGFNDEAYSAVLG